MSFTQLQDSQPKARKDHKCSWCGELIHKGTIYNYSTGIFDGHFYTSHTHDECLKAMHRSRNEKSLDDDGFTPYEQLRGKSIGEQMQMEDLKWKNRS